MNDLVGSEGRASCFRNDFLLRTSCSYWTLCRELVFQPDHEGCCELSSNWIPADNLLVTFLLLVRINNVIWILNVTNTFMLLRESHRRTTVIYIYRLTSMWLHSDTLPASALDAEKAKTLAPHTDLHFCHHISVFTPNLCAQAWDLLAHMRYVAHPVPDVILYTVMICVCASPVNMCYLSEPEKALDIWTEMIQDQRNISNHALYNAINLACAKSGTTTRHWG